MPDASPILSIIIVSFNARADLERCLESIHAAHITTPHEIIVVDNQSSDGSAGAARRWPDVRVIETGGNLGFARACNIGIRASTGANLLLLNSDTIVPEHVIDWLVEQLAKRPDAAVIGPRLVDGDGRVELSFGRAFGPFNELRQKILARGLAKRQPLISMMVERMTHHEQAPDWVSGACLLVRRQDAEAVGLLDERYFMYGEDVDFCVAIRAKGRRVLYLPQAQLVHLGGRSVASDPDTTRKAYVHSHIAYYEKHRPLWAPVLKAYLRLRGQL